MNPSAPCYDNPEPFGAGASFGDPELARELCSQCPVDKVECLVEFARLHDSRFGVHGGMTVAGLSGDDLRRAMTRARGAAA